jgi:hypothetical protein
MLKFCQKHSQTKGISLAVFGLLITSAREKLCWTEKESFRYDPQSTLGMHAVLFL